ncbi:MAG: type ISP restriction/modification enzyme [Gammaproteobacteria bacterium]
MPDFETDLNLYLTKIARQESGDSELTHRTALETFLGTRCPNNISPRHEQVLDGGRKSMPDFSIVNEKDHAIIGLLENKRIGEQITNHVNSNQIKKYREHNENIILTNYHDWLLLKNGEIVQKASLGTVAEIKNKQPPSKEQILAIKNLLDAFLSTEPIGIGTTKQLAKMLAIYCNDIQKFLTIELQKQQKQEDAPRLINMYKAFKEYVDGELTLERFAKIFAETLGYSFFLAKLNAKPTDKITFDNIRRLIPQQFALIRSLADFLKEIEENQYQPIRHRVEAILGMMNHLDLRSIKGELEGKKRLDLDDDDDPMIAHDPFIYFYEFFLKEYDARERADRGVYYTPPSVVYFIIRTINDILEKQFDIKDGLADSNHVQVLDFATGTGTFLLEAIRQIFERPEIRDSKGTKKALIKDHILKNFYGFEYLMAPYVVAHLKLSQFLQSKGFTLSANEPLQILLTNTLKSRPAEDSFPFMEELQKESQKAHEVKEKPIRVITGNPPYNVKSQNKGDIDELVTTAYRPKNEKKMNWDDYVKFIRFAHHKMENTDRGVIGIITNNSFLNAITLRKMRNRLRKDFNAIYILNLHGNSNIKETTPDGQPDKNVFDIRVGVCITFLVKTEAEPKDNKIYYAALQSSKQKQKWQMVADSNMDIFKPLNPKPFNTAFAKTRWQQKFAEPLDFFVPMEDDIGNLTLKYGDFWGVIDIFNHYNSGIQTKRDEFTIYHSEEKLKKVIKDYKVLTENEIRKKYNLPEDGRDWTIGEAIESVKETPDANIQPIQYRPFDKRFTLLNTKSKGFLAYPRWETMQHMLAGENLGIIFRRTAENTSRWQQIAISEHIIDINYLSAQTYLAPLYIYPLEEKEAGKVKMENPSEGGFALVEKDENFTRSFREFINKKYDKHYNPEQILAYIYAVLHSPNFRKKYEELLKIDFPRIPFIDDETAFAQLAKLGQQLIDAHLLKIIPKTPNCQLRGVGDEKVEKPIYVADKKTLHINKTQHFTNVPKEAWEFEIGGYQVLDKYLKERKKADRPLSSAEILHFPKIVKILVYTHKQMQTIDDIFPCP